MLFLLTLLFLAPILLAISLEGTWMSYSKSVVTGPEFYDPIDELIYEPALPGICYSFDDNGNWEQAIYQVLPNPIRPEASTATILWQHGKYKENKDGSLTLKPYESDGRKLFSDPINHEESIYMRYNEVEKIDHYVIEFDHYQNRYKLQLYAFDGSKKQPLWLEFKPPKMLPTQVLNPVNEKQKNSLKNFNRRLKRSLENRKNTSMKRRDGVSYFFHACCITLLLICVLTLLWLLRRQRSIRNI